MPATDDPAAGDSGIPWSRNRNVKCSGKSVIRYAADDDEGHRKGDPILDEDGARTYRPCNAFAAHGTDYCANHGGNAPQVINAAKRTLALAAERAAEGLATIANDERVAPETRIRAQAQLLDRVGVRAGTEISLETPGWQAVLGKMFGLPAESSTQDDEPASDHVAGAAVDIVETPAKQRKARPPVAPTPPAEETKPVAKKAKRSKSIFEE